MGDKTCCFFGYGKLPKENIENLLKRLNNEMDTLIRQGVENFIFSGAPGFDQMAASLIVAKKEMGNNIRLIFALTYKNHDEHWNAEQKKLLHKLLAEADEIIYVSEKYQDNCTKKRNRYMAEHSMYCMYVRGYSFNGKDRIRKYMRQKGLKIINVVF
jgi:uncharacterized phage-like protein YoqJ